LQAAIKLRRISSFVVWKAIRGRKLSGAVGFPAVRRVRDSARRSNAFEKHSGAQNERFEEILLAGREAKREETKTKDVFREDTPQIRQGASVERVSKP